MSHASDLTERVAAAAWFLDRWRRPDNARSLAAALDGLMDVGRRLCLDVGPNWPAMRECGNRVCAAVLLARRALDRLDTRRVAAALEALAAESARVAAVEAPMRVAPVARCAPRHPGFLRLVCSR